MKTNAILVHETPCFPQCDPFLVNGVDIHVRQESISNGLCSILYNINNLPAQFLSTALFDTLPTAKIKAVDGTFTPDYVSYFLVFSRGKQNYVLYVNDNDKFKLKVRFAT